MASGAFVIGIGIISVLTKVSHGLQLQSLLRTLMQL